VIPTTTPAQQVPPVSTVDVPSTLPNGVITFARVVFTQSFSAVPDQLPSPSTGSIGLGTLSGTVGAVRTEQAKSGAASLRLSSSPISTLRVLLRPWRRRSIKTATSSSSSSPISSPPLFYAPSSFLSAVMMAPAAAASLLLLPLLSSLLATLG
jgi:hypothetical protein